MIAGIGLDLFETRRFAKHRSNPEFLSQIFSPAEIQRMEAGPRPDRAPALLFTVKESVRKALGKELAPGWFWRHVRIDPGPVVRITEKMRRLRFRGNTKIFHCAAGHCRRFNFALTLIEK